MARDQGRANACCWLLLLASAGCSQVSGSGNSVELPVKIERAFPELEVERPLALTYANDGSGRIYVASQLGRVFMVPPGDEGAGAKLFLDIADRVAYLDRENEKGFLGLAFHPRYAETGELFVFYTPPGPVKLVVSRFRRSASDPDVADPGSEEVLLSLEKKLWNHNGGTLAFGPDGYLYVAIGDGGTESGDSGQNLGVLFAKILRIDVDRREGDLAYGVPADNPFVGRAGARPEIWAYGLRNVWRMSFDRQTEDFWAGDVGRGQWEEIDLIQRGGNYGWSVKEGNRTLDWSASGQYIAPIWTYHHDVGKSIIGGHVYRGARAPALAGKYLYADHVTGQLWALDYDVKGRRVVRNHAIAGNQFPVLSFGEDHEGEVYILRQDGRIYRFVSSPHSAVAAKSGR